jgi:hypothetical protein
VDLSDPRLYDQASPEDRLLFLRSQLYAIRAAIVQARDRGDTAALTSLLALFRQIANRAAELTGVVNQADQPSQFMRALSSFSDDMLSAGAAVGGAFLDTAKAAKGAIDATIGATSLTVSLLPWLLLAAGIVLVIVVLRSSGLSISGSGVSVRR